MASGPTRVLAKYPRVSYNLSLCRVPGAHSVGCQMACSINTQFRSVGFAE